MGRRGELGGGEPDCTSEGKREKAMHHAKAGLGKCQLHLNPDGATKAIILKKARRPQAIAAKKIGLYLRTRGSRTVIRVGGGNNTTGRT